MKKFVALTVALALCLSFAACSSEESGSEKNDALAEVTPARGTVENGIYKNEAFGFSFAAGENWYFLSDSEISTAMGLAAEEIYGEGAEITGDHIYDVYCVDNATNATVSINYEDLGTIGGITDANYYLENMMTQLISTGIDSGIKDTIISNIKISGTQVPCLYILLDYGGTEIHEKIIVKQIGTWMGTITLASLSEEELDLLVEKISFE